MKLNEYLKKTGQTQTAFAERLGITVGMVSHIARGRKTPSLHVAVRIETATEGEVTVRDLLPEDRAVEQKEAVA